MKEIKIAFDDKDINVKTGEMSGREFLTALGTAFIAGCEKFNLEPLRAIEALMDAEDAAEDGKDEDNGSFWYDDNEYCDECCDECCDACCDVCGQFYSCCDCDDFYVGG